MRVDMVEKDLMTMREFGFEIQAYGYSTFHMSGSVGNLVAAACGSSPADEQLEQFHAESLGYCFCRQPPPGSFEQ